MSRRSTVQVPAVLLPVVCPVFLLLIALAPARAGEVPGEGTPWPAGMADPVTVVRKGLPVVPGLPQEELARWARGNLPFQPVERDPVEGVRHGWVQTTSGRFAFRVRDLELPARLPFAVGRVYDSGLAGALPGVPSGDEPRTSRDLGPNWMLAPGSVLLAANGGYLLVTDDAGVVRYVPDGAGGWRPDPDRPLRYGRLEPAEGGGWRVRLAEGLWRTYRRIDGEPNFWLVREEDGAGNALVYRYRDGYLWRIESTGGSWVEFRRPMWGEPAAPSTPGSRVVAIEDSAGRRVELGYDGAGRLVRSSGPGEGTWVYEWDGADHVSRVVDPLGRPVFAVVTDGLDRAVDVAFGGGRTTYAYGGDRTTVTDPAGREWVYGHDAAGFTTWIEEPGGGVTTLERDPASGDLVRVVDPVGGEHRFEHDGRHRLTAYEGPEVDGERPRWEYSRDAAGDLVRVRTPCGTVTELERDERGLLVAERVDADRDGTAEVERRWERDPATGDVLAEVDPEGRRTEYEWDGRGSLVGVRPGCGAAPCPEIRMERDAAGRLVRLGWPLAEGEWSWWTVTWHPNGVPAAVEDPLGRRWETGLTPAGRPGWVRTPAGGTWRYGYDATGRIVRVEDPLGHVYRWEYGAGGREVRWTDPEGGEWWLRRDGRGLPVEYRDPEGNAWRWERDAAGRVREVQLPGGNSIELVRDAAGRVVERRLPGGAVERYRWDAEGNLLEVERTFPAEGGTGRDRWRYEWDGRGLPLSVSEEIDAGEGAVLSRVLSWEWDRSGMLARWTDGDGITWSAERDAAGRLVRIGDGVSVRVEIERDPWSGRVVRRRDGSVEERYRYDAAGGVAWYEERSNGRVARRASYGRDGAGRVVSIVDELAEPPGETTIERDLLDRVVEVVHPDGGGERYLRDGAGRLRRWESWTADGAADREEYVRDRAGRPVAVYGRRFTLTYDWRFGEGDGLATVERNGTGELDRRTRLRLDADGRVDRVEELVDGEWREVRRFRWMPGGGGDPVALDAREPDGTAAERRRWLTGPGVVLGAYDGTAGSPAWTPSLEWAWWRLDAGGWREWVAGRRDSSFDEVPLLRRPAVAQDELGGQGARGGLRLPGRELLAGLAWAELPGGEAARRSLAGLPSPAYPDRERGLVGDRDVELLPPLRGLSVGVPVVCAQHPGMQLGMVRCPGGLVVRKAISRGDRERDELCLGLPQECETPSGGFVGASCGPDQRSQPLEPLRNPARHPLGVSLSNGELAFGVTDLVVAGRGGVDLRLSRTYRHQSSRRGLLGMGWSLGLLDERLLPATCGDVILWYREDGSFVTFPRLFDDGDVARKDYGRMVRYVPGGSGHALYEVRRPDGTVIRFEDFQDPPAVPGLFTVRGYPVRVTRPGGAALEISWERREWGEDTGCGSSWMEPVSVKLWSCDDDDRTNPLGAEECRSSKVLLAEATFEVGEHGCEHLVESVEVRERAPGGEWSVRRLRYGYGSPRGSGPFLLESVEFAAGEPGGGNGDGETVARYRYGFDLGEAGLEWDTRLREVRNGAGELVLGVHYDLDSGGRKKDTVDRVETPSHVVEFDYEESNHRFSRATVTEAGRRTVHVFDEHGHEVRVERPDGSVVEYEYDSIGRMTRALAPRGKGEEGTARPEKVWVYSGPRWGVAVENPVKYGELPASFAHGEVATWYCYESDPLTGAVRLSRGPIERTDREEPDCSFRDGDGNLLPDVTEVVLGWQEAAPSAEEGEQTSDPDLERYLERWGFAGTGEEPLPFRGTGDARAAWPWLSRVEEWRPGTTERVGPDGEKEPVDPAERPLVTTSYNGEGLPVARTTWIASSGGGARTFVRRECLHWLAPGEAGPGPGSRDAHGRLAQREVLGEDVPCPATGDGDPGEGVLLSRERYGYDGWGNVTRVLRQQDADRWVVSRKEFDYRGRLLAEWTESGDGSTRGAVTRYRYDAAGRLLQRRVEWTDGGEEHGQLTEWSYDEETHLLAEETSWPDSSWLAGAPAAVGKAWTGTGTASRHLYRRDELGNVVREARLVEASPEGWSVVTREWDALNRLVEERLWAEAQADPLAEEPSGPWSGRRTWRDAAGRVVAVQETGGEPAGDGTAEETVGRTVRYEYDGLDRVRVERVCRSAARGGDTAPECTETLREVESWYDRWGKVSERKVRGYERAEGGGDAEVRLYGWSQWERDGAGRVLEERSARSLGGEWLPAECPLEGNGSCAWMRVRAGRDGLGRKVREAELEPGRGWRVTEIELDGLGRRARVRDPLGNAVEYERNLLGRVTVKRLVEPGSSWEPGGRVVETGFRYDGLGRPVAVVLPDPGTGEEREVRRGYDGRGLVSWERVPPGTEPGTYETRYEYDGYGRKVKERRRIGEAPAWSDPWREVRYGYDVAGRLRWIEVDPDRAGEGAPVQRTEYRYDGAGRRVLRRLPNGREQRLAYDALGRLVETTWASGGGVCGEEGTGCVRISGSWDQAGRRTARAVTLLGVAAEHYDGVTEDRWEYDALDRVVRSESRGVLAGEAYEVVVRRTYDSGGLPLSETVGPEDGGWTVGWTYDALGRRTEVRYPEAGGGLVLEYDYDRLDRVVRLGASPGPVPVELEYVGASRVVRARYGDGTEWRGYRETDGGVETLWDGALRRTGGLVWSPGGGDPLYEEEIGYDAGDRVTHVVWSHGRVGPEREGQEYQYDEAGRLTGFRQGLWDESAEEVSPGDVTASHTWQLDGQGNWRKHWEGDRGADGVPEQEIDPVNAYLGWTSAEDADGDGVLDLDEVEHDDVRGFLWRRKAGGEWRRYVHDGLGRLVGVQREVPGGVEWIARYGYDTEGRLAFREDGSGRRTWYVRDGDRTVVEVKVEGETAEGVRRNVWLGDRLVRSESGSGGSWSVAEYAHVDRVGSVVLTTREVEGVVEVTGRTTYGPYGEEERLPSWSGPGVSVPYGYAGAWRDGEAGLYRMGARWYDAELGRFLEQDPVGESGGLNLYGYVGSSPTLWVDPTGLAADLLMPGLSGGTRQRAGDFIGQVLVDGVRTDDPLTGEPGTGWLAWFARLFGFPREKKGSRAAIAMAKDDLLKAAQAWKEARNRANEAAKNGANEETVQGILEPAARRFRDAISHARDVGALRVKVQADDSFGSEEEASRAKLDAMAAYVILGAQAEANAGDPLFDGPRAKLGEVRTIEVTKTKKSETLSLEGWARAWALVWGGWSRAIRVRAQSIPEMQATLMHETTEVYARQKWRLVGIDGGLYAHDLALVAENVYRQRYGIGEQNLNWGFRNSDWHGDPTVLDLLRKQDPAAVRGLLPWEDATKGERSAREAMEWVGEVLGW